VDEKGLDEDETFEEFSFQKPESWRDKYSELVLIGLVVLVALLVLLFWPGSNPCKGAPSGAVVEDPDHAGVFKQCT
jgi:hypothetical protein